MFTQESGINTNKCNGCNKHCVVSAFYYSKPGTSGYLPVIDNKVKTHYFDSQGNKHNSHLYRTAHDAMNCAKILTKKCPSFKDIRILRQPTTALDYDICTGCPKRCAVSSQKIQGIFYPKIGSKTITKYINTFGETQIPPVYHDDFHAKMHAMHKISKLCDHYQNKK